jgi:hypothetical protein
MRLPTSVEITVSAAAAAIVAVVRSQQFTANARIMWNLGNGVHLWRGTRRGTDAT